MILARGLGHRPDLLDHVEEDLRDRHVSTLPGLTASIASARDWRHLSPFVYDQVLSEACVAFAGRDAIFCAGQHAAELGVAPPIPLPSVAFPWAAARLTDQEIDGVPRQERILENVGVRPRSMMIAYETYGIVSEVAMPFDLANLNAGIPFDIDIAAADALLTGRYRISDSDESWLIALALDKGHFPTVAFDWYDSFAEHTGSAPLDEPHGRMRGRHMVLCIGYRKGFTLIKNSHSAFWGDGGFAWVSNRFIDSPYCRDGNVITAAPRIAV